VRVPITDAIGAKHRSAMSARSNPGRQPSRQAATLSSSLGVLACGGCKVAFPILDVTQTDTAEIIVDDNQLFKAMLMPEGGALDPRLRLPRTVIRFWSSIR